MPRRPKHIVIRRVAGGGISVHTVDGAVNVRHTPDVTIASSPGKSTEEAAYEAALTILKIEKELAQEKMLLGERPLGW
ncbi:MAG: hypothetical protein DRI48_11355 [Chloroflexi bacterium]|nr:MAG: hypothetical protein DRI48_11355 [Chloroflexota bacterium]